MKNTLTIHWKKHLGKNMTPCPPPQQETFKGISTLQRAWEIINRRVKDNMAYAVYNGDFLLKADKVVKKAPEPVVIEELVNEVAETTGFFSKLTAGFRKNFSPKKMFSRQKH